MASGCGLGPTVRLLRRPAVDGSGEEVAKHGRECTEGDAGVAARVLVLRAHLGGGAVVAERDEDRVVAEAIAPPRLPEEHAVEAALDDDPATVRGPRRRRTHERRPAAVIRYVGDLLEHQPQVR